MFIPYPDIIKITPELSLHLAVIRTRRNFHDTNYIEAKIEAINAYFTKHRLQVAVIGISGGIDSAVCLELLQLAQKSDNSPIMRIVPVMLYSDISQGVTSNNYLRDLIDSCYNEFFEQVAIESVKEIVKSVSEAAYRTANTFQQDEPTTIENDFNAWSIGQLVPHARTMVLAALCSYFTGNNQPAVVIGTTNKDEYSYLGYFGKYSDGLVDLQIISDLHKSEVYTVAKWFGVPKIIVEKAPNGDMFNGATDEQVFGVDYDMVELITTIQNQTYPCPADPILLRAYRRLTDLHNQNKHKYLSGIPCVELDILPAGCLGGKSLNLSERYYAMLDNLGDISKPCFVGNFNIGDYFDYAMYREQFNRLSLLNVDKFYYGDSNPIIHIKNALPVNFANEIKHMFDNQKFKGVVRTTNIQGYVSNGAYGTNSERASFYSHKLSKRIWNYIQHELHLAFTGDGKSTEWVEGSVWVPIGINPLFRIINYVNDGQLVAHYDYPYVDKQLSDKRTVKSLFSLVMYINTNDGDGTTFYEDDEKFTVDESWNYDVVKRSQILEDRTVAQTKQLKKKMTLGKTGDICIFPHFMLHGSEPCKNKMIIRTDIMFEQIV